MPSKGGKGRGGEGRGGEGRGGEERGGEERGGEERGGEGRGREGREGDGPTCLLLATIQDLGSLLKDGDSRGLILVSYGATVMRIPKQQLAMATLSCWRALLAEARNSKR